jgi:hypothetical protein
MFILRSNDLPYTPTILLTLSRGVYQEDTHAVDGLGSDINTELRCQFRDFADPFLDTIVVVVMSIYLFGWSQNSRSSH